MHNPSGLLPKSQRKIVLQRSDSFITVVVLVSQFADCIICSDHGVQNSGASSSFSFNSNYGSS